MIVACAVCFEANKVLIFVVHLLHSIELKPMITYLP